MCGILGITFRSDRRLEFGDFRSALNDLFLCSESRGKESSGVAVRGTSEISVMKSPVPASRFIRTREYRRLIAGLNREVGGPESAVVIGHSRLVTTGGQEQNANNQPVATSEIAGVHNGIVVNHEALWKKYPKLQHDTEVDSEVIFRLLEHHLRKGRSLGESFRKTFKRIDGQASVIALFSRFNGTALYSNHGSLFVTVNRAAGIALCASERVILKNVLRRLGLQDEPCTTPIRKIAPSTGLFLRADDLALVPLDKAKPDAQYPCRVVDRSSPCESSVHSSLAKFQSVDKRRLKEFEKAFKKRRQQVGQLRRCRKCLLPETMPFIHYDAEGACNYCANHLSTHPRSRDELEEIIGPIRRNDGEPDCLVGLSGGRDSSYALHVVKTQLKLNPVAFTYDWGMVTDLARRNISRMCGRLGVEHILVSANLRQKRDNVRRNMNAWLRKPDLGMIPLFMAGDKQYFYHARRLRRELGVDLSILGENLLERTDFKSGFSGSPPGSVDRDRVYVLSKQGRTNMLLHYAKGFLSNPGYWNRSVPDTLWAYGCFYVIPRDYLNLFRYVTWKEEVVEQTLQSEYGWEMAPDTRTSWRIGDGTASFYNYAYYMAAGFSEFDTFRSNQIREGIITRDEGLALIEEENQPRFSSIQQYCELIGVDFEHAIRSINRIPTLFPS